MIEPLIIAVPKGRILAELAPVFARAGLTPEPEFYREDTRKMQFATTDPQISLVQVRSFDVATFVSFGGAHLGICGGDVLLEFDSPELYAPVDLNIGHCRVSLAAPQAIAEATDTSRWSHVRVATKYPNIARRYFAGLGIQTECIKLNGAMELAPLLGISPYIVDLVSTGRTLRENGLVEMQEIAPVSSRLIVNRTAMKTRGSEIGPWVERFAP
jgi:ATP phosphoribosyltransferase